MFNLKKISVCFSIFLFTLPMAHSQEGVTEPTEEKEIPTEKNTDDKYKLNSEERKILEQNTLSYRANELKDMYAEMAINESISFDRSYLLDEPLNLNEVLDFKHPYLNILVSELTEADREAIMKSMQTEQSKQYRYKAIMQSAMKFATDSALYRKTRSFHQRAMTENYHDLSQTFPFYALTLEDGKIKPPVIEEIGFTRTKESKRVRREKKKRYRIKTQAEVINSPQTFMDFFSNLLTEKPKTPNVYMLPINDEEIKYWRKGILHGWLEGNRLANEIIREDIRKLVSEFYGQVRFHQLARAKVISRPTSQNINIGTNSNGLSINIGESIFEITELPRFNDNEMSWIALPQVDDIFDKLTSQDVYELSIYLDHPGDSI